MSHDPQHDTSVETHHSEPHAGHGGTSYEGIDASVKMVVFSLITIAAILVISFGIVIPLHRILREANPAGSLPSAIAPERIVPAEPRLEVHPWETYPDLVAKQDAILQSAGKDE